MELSLSSLELTVLVIQLVLLVLSFETLNTNNMQHNNGLSEVFYHSGKIYSGPSNKDKQHCLVNKATGERISLVPFMEQVRMKKLK